LAIRFERLPRLVSPQRTIKSTLAQLPEQSQRTSIAKRLIGLGRVGGWRVARRDRDTAFLCSKSDEVSQWIECGGSDIRVSRQISSCAEQRAWVPSFARTVGNVVPNRIDTSGRDVRVFTKI